MTTILTSFTLRGATSPADAMSKLSESRLRAARDVADYHTHIFSTMVPWPALAESWRTDLRRIDAELAGRGA